MVLCVALWASLLVCVFGFIMVGMEVVRWLRE